MPADPRKAADKFMDALHRLEESGDVEAIAARFAPDAQVLALVAHRAHRGEEGVRQFWREYLKPFATIHSEFTRVAADGRLVVLEWTGKGTLKDASGRRGADRPIEYGGCSVLELDEQGKVKRFRTYYDSAAFVTVEAGVR